MEDAERCFGEALELEHEHGARIEELLCAIGLARVARDQNDVRGIAEARARLAPLYAWFSEGLDTRPLRRAQKLLEELA
jgi:hypothetical protein